MLVVAHVMFARYRFIFYLPIQKAFAAYIQKGPAGENYKIASYNPLSLLGTLSKGLLRSLFYALKTPVLAPKLQPEAKATLKAPAHWYFVTSRNNWIALNKYHAADSNAVWVGPQAYDFCPGIQILPDKKLPARPSFYLFGFYLWLHPDYTARTFSRLEDQGHYHQLYTQHLLAATPAAIFFSNDHSAKPRALLRAALDLNIPTLFVQHANVGTLFPPLSFGLSLLDGAYAAEVYAKAGPAKSQVVLAGTAKPQLTPEQWNTHLEVGRLGIAFNLLDSLEEVLNLVQLLRRELPALQLVLRSHPMDNRLLTDALPPEVLLSDARQENTLAFFQQIDALVANLSSIHLEAALANVWPIQLNLLPPGVAPLDDLYGFKEKSLTTPCPSPQALPALLSQGREPGLAYRLKARPFEASVTPRGGYEDQFPKAQAVISHYLHNP